MAGSSFVDAPRAVVTPGGDYLLSIVAGEGHHAGVAPEEKVNDVYLYRSGNRGVDWSGPFLALPVPYNRHGWSLLVPEGSGRVYAFGTEPAPGHFDGLENAAISTHYSEDDGHTWSEPSFIRPENDAGFQGMSIMPACETGSGAWLLGSQTGTRYFPGVGGEMTTVSRQYVLRSEDRGEYWAVLPSGRPGGWYWPPADRMDEMIPVALVGGEIYALCRTAEGHLFEMRSLDDGKTWSSPRPSPLVHPDAPPMLSSRGEDGLLVALHHNRPASGHFAEMDRSELWLSSSWNGGRSWSEPRLVLTNASRPTEEGERRRYEVSYCDILIDGDDLHVFIPHVVRFEARHRAPRTGEDLPAKPRRLGQLVHAHLRIESLSELPTRGDLQAASGC